VWPETREIVRDTGPVGLPEAIHETGMLLPEIGSLICCRVLHLAQQVIRMLAGKSRITFEIITCGAQPMAGRAPTCVRFASSLQEPAIPGSLARRRFQYADVSSDIGDILRICQMVLVSEVLHPHIPATVLPKIDQLAGDDTKVLSGHRRYGAIARASAVNPVARGAGCKQFRAM
jgi:hypothetical protein